MALEVHIEATVPQGMLDELGPELVERLLDDLAMAARARWINLAKAGLHSTSQEYVQGLQEVESRPGVRTITLVGWLPNSLEQGLEAFDMREGMLSSPKAHVSADGHKYRAIPFRHATPGTVGQAGPEMGMRYGPQGSQSRAWASAGHFSGSEAQQAGKALYARAKKLKGVTWKISAGGRSGATIMSRHAGTRLGEQSDLFPKLAPWHATDIYAGMTKTGGAGHKQYMTFRTISDRTDVGWVHPGLEARHYAEQVGEHIQNLVPRALQAALARH
jgi:hypothetical protein